MQGKSTEINMVSAHFGMLQGANEECRMNDVYEVMQEPLTVMLEACMSVIREVRDESRRGSFKALPDDKK